MKLNLCQDSSVAETEITIRYAEMDTSIQRLIEKIEQHKSFIVGYQQNRQFQLPVDSIYFIDSVDGRTFLYQEKEVYECKETLVQLETRFCQTELVRISKNCIVNICFLSYVEPFFNHRLKAVLNNGETLIITRSYIDTLRTRLKGV